MRSRPSSSSCARGPRHPSSPAARQLSGSRCLPRSHSHGCDVGGGRAEYAAIVSSRWFRRSSGSLIVAASPSCQAVRHGCVLAGHFLLPRGPNRTGGKTAAARRSLIQALAGLVAASDRGCLRSAPVRACLPLLSLLSCGSSSGSAVHPRRRFGAAVNVFIDRPFATLRYQHLREKAAVERQRLMAAASQAAGPRGPRPRWRGAREVPDPRGKRFSACRPAGGG